MLTDSISRTLTSKHPCLRDKGNGYGEERNEKLTMGARNKARESDDDERGETAARSSQAATRRERRENEVACQVTQVTSTMTSIEVPRKGPRSRSKVEGWSRRRKKATASSKRPRKSLSKSIENRDRSKTPPCERFRAKANSRTASRRRKIVARRSNEAAQEKGIFGRSPKGSPTRTERARLSTFVRKARRASENEPRPLRSGEIGDFAGRGHPGKHGSLGFSGGD